jgi:hypothetical protein
VTKPSDFATGLLVTGVGFALIAAMCLMAASFQRNVKAGIDADFTRFAIVVAYLGAALVVVGTILSLGKTDATVTIVAVANLCLAVFAVIVALYAQLVFRRDVRSHKDTCCQCVGREQGSEDDTAEVMPCPHVAAEKQHIDDRQRPEALTEDGERR